jgi:hypothetical protein
VDLDSSESAESNDSFRVHPQDVLPGLFLQNYDLAIYPHYSEVAFQSKKMSKLTYLDPQDYSKCQKHNRTIKSKLFEKNLTCSISYRLTNENQFF